MAKTYTVIDLSGGSDAPNYPVTYLETVPEEGWTDQFRGDRMVLRLVPPGAFLMGSPKTELGRSPKETRCEVTLTKPYYIGVFEVTQRQWRNVMGTNPSAFRGDYRPVERVSYPMIRGTTKGTHWPADNEVDDDSSLGVLRTKTGLTCDLPTEAQWEYACRAGTTTALNSGQDLTSRGDCPHMAQVARYGHNQTLEVGGYKQHTTVGSYLPNAWGLYDMHGNVGEWCLDWGTDNIGTSPTTNPLGPAEGARRAVRGSTWRYGANGGRSASRSTSRTDGLHTTLGLRVAISPGTL